MIHPDDAREHVRPPPPATAWDIAGVVTLGCLSAAVLVGLAIFMQHDKAANSRAAEPVIIEHPCHCHERPDNVRF
jgi:hypothetical protein